MGRSRYVEIAKSTLDVVTLDEAKAWMRLSNSAEDEIISGLIQSAVDSAESCMNRDILTTTYENYRSSFFQPLELRRGGFQSVVQIEYLKDDVYTILDPSEYVVGKGDIFGDICTVNAPSHDNNCNSVKITFKSGYGDDNSSVPSDIKTAIKKHVSSMYQNRGDCDDGGAVPKGAMGTYIKNILIDISGDPDVCM